MNKVVTPPRANSTIEVSSPVEEKITVLNPIGYPAQSKQEGQRRRGPRVSTARPSIWPTATSTIPIELLNQVQAWFGDHMPNVKTSNDFAFRDLSARRSQDLGRIRGKGDAAILGVGHCSTCAPAVATHAITLETRYGVPTVGAAYREIDRVVQSVTRMAGLPDSQRAFVPGRSWARAPRSCVPMSTARTRSPAARSCRRSSPGSPRAERLSIDATTTALERPPPLRRAGYRGQASAAFPRE